jgi:hypothetical protein
MVLKSVPVESLVSQLVSNGVFLKTHIEAKLSGKMPNDRDEALLIELENAAREGGTISLLHYEMSLLPDTKAKISVVGPAGVVEFEHLEG